MNERTFGIVDLGKFCLIIVLLVGLPILGVGSVSGQEYPTVWISMTSAILLIPPVVFVLYWPNRDFWDEHIYRMPVFLAPFIVIDLLLFLLLTGGSIADRSFHIAPQITISTLTQVALLIRFVYGQRF